jgi:hypothetical protein
VAELAQLWLGYAPAWARARQRGARRVSFMLMPATWPSHYETFLEKLNQLALSQPRVLLLKRPQIKLNWLQMSNKLLHSHDAGHQFIETVIVFITFLKGRFF